MIADLQPGEVVVAEKIDRISRLPLAVWSQRVRNTAEQWSSTELEFSEKLRGDLLLFLSTVRLEQIAWNRLPCTMN
jgi:light-regulated signal transduction histidine kinase (bacteriophytochrome)